MLVPFFEVYHKFGWIFVFVLGERGISLTIKSAGILTGGNRGAAFNTRIGITKRFCGHFLLTKALAQRLRI
jgi:hypothetical protein